DLVRIHASQVGGISVVPEVQDHLDRLGYLLSQAGWKRRIACGLTDDVLAVGLTLAIQRRVAPVHAPLEHAQRRFAITASVDLSIVPLPKQEVLHHVLVLEFKS